MMANEGFAADSALKSLPDRIALKRVLDIALASFALVLLAPLLLLIAAVIRATSPGPALFRQWRHGLLGTPFLILKFRTLPYPGTTFEQIDIEDPRLTPIGRWLRRSRLDELPQFWNVLRGEMSLVGPRPHALAHGDELAALASGYHLRHRVRPGMTGLAQVEGCRGPIRSPEHLTRRLELDLAYIRDWSLRGDLAILLRTPCLWLRPDPP
jgi:lipopolysaccharide/colanic/teichoic acid biosynthesis glycosyltransferase